MSIHFNPYSASVAIWQQGIEKKNFFEHVFGISITFKCSTFIVVECLFTV